MTQKTNRYTEYVDDFEIEREDGSFDTRDVEIDYLIWFKKIDKENANVYYLYILNTVRQQN